MGHGGWAVERLNCNPKVSSSNLCTDSNLQYVPEFTQAWWGTWLTFGKLKAVGNTTDHIETDEHGFICPFDPKTISIHNPFKVSIFCHMCSIKENSSFYVADRFPLKNRERVEKIQALMISCLQHLIRKNHPPHRWAVVLGCAFNMLTTVREIGHAYIMFAGKNGMMKIHMYKEKVIREIISGRGGGGVASYGNLEDLLWRHQFMRWIFFSHNLKKKKVYSFQIWTRTKSAMCRSKFLYVHVNINVFAYNNRWLYF